MRLHSPSDPRRKAYIEIEISKEELTEKVIAKYRKKAEEIRRDMDKPDSKN